MRNNAFIPLYASLNNHPKMLRLCCILGMTTEDEKLLLRAKVENLWMWTLSFFPEGEICSIEPRVIAHACGWNDDPDIWIGALIQSGFLEQTIQGYAIPNWHLYGGKTILKKKSDAERKRRSRQDAENYHESINETVHVGETLTSQHAGKTPPSPPLPYVDETSAPQNTDGTQTSQPKHQEAVSTFSHLVDEWSDAGLWHWASDWKTGDPSAGHPRDNDTRFLFSLLMLQLGICHFMFNTLNQKSLVT